MSTQLIAVVAVIGLAIGALFMAAFAVAACQMSSEISQYEERHASANGDYPAAPGGPDDGSEHDDG